MWQHNNLDLLMNTYPFQQHLQLHLWSSALRSSLYVVPPVVQDPGTPSSDKGQTLNRECKQSSYDRFNYSASRSILYSTVYITIEPILSVYPSVHRTRFIYQHIFHYGFFLSKNQTSSSLPVLDEGLHQLRSQAGQAVRMMSWITKLPAFFWNLPSILCVWELEVEVRWKSPEKVQDIGSAVITQDAFGLNARAELDLHVVVVKHLVALNSQRSTCLIQKLQKPATLVRKLKCIFFFFLHVNVCCIEFNVLLPWMCKNSFSIVIGTINYTLLLVFLQYTRNYCLSNNTDAPIIHHSCPKCV